MCQHPRGKCSPALEQRAVIVINSNGSPMAEPLFLVLKTDPLEFADGKKMILCTKQKTENGNLVTRFVDECVRLNGESVVYNVQ